MPEIQIDPLSGAKTIVAADRASRPGAGLTALPPQPIDPERDPFAPGHEDRTPPEVYAVRPNGGAPNGPGWTVRVVPNLYPAITQDAAKPAATARPDLYAGQAASGAHEVIINAPDPVMSLASLAPEQVEAAVEVWRERMRAHPDAACRHLIVNERPEAGASLPHTHAQFYALDFVPAQIARERERFTAYAERTTGGNLLADLVQEEVRLRERVVAIDDDVVLLAPYASRVAYQLMIVPRRPRAKFEDDGPTGARMLHEALRRLADRLGASPPLNLWVRTAPRGADRFCWRIDIYPRLANLAGLELGAGVHINIVPPEVVASELRER
jgi:UDPglucose--hexose-1-phosphate uridylyltransferase